MHDFSSQEARFGCEVHHFRLLLVRDLFDNVPEAQPYRSSFSPVQYLSSSVIVGVCPAQWMRKHSFYPLGVNFLSGVDYFPCSIGWTNLHSFSFFRLRYSFRR